MNEMFTMFTVLFSVKHIFSPGTVVVVVVW